MSEHRWDAETREVISAAIRLAIAPPKEPNKWAYAAKVPWTAINDLRSALDAAGINWRKLK